MRLHIKILSILSIFLVYNICLVSQMWAGKSVGASEAMVPPGEGADDQDVKDTSSSDSSNSNDSNSGQKQ